MLAAADTLARQIASVLGTSPEHGWFVLGALVGLALGWLVRRPRAGSIGTEVQLGPALRGPSRAAGGAWRTTTTSSATVASNGCTIDVGQDVLDAVNELLHAGRKLDAIKRLREETQLGLAEAKALADALDSALRAADAGARGA
jgi:hypothetical protein